MKIETEFWVFSVFPTFIKAMPTRKNRYADGMRIYSSSDGFEKDFGDYAESKQIIDYFDTNKTTNKRPMRRVYLK